MTMGDDVFLLQQSWSCLDIGCDKRIATGTRFWQKVVVTLWGANLIPTKYVVQCRELYLRCFLRAHIPGGNVFDMVYCRKNLHTSDKAKNHTSWYGLWLRHLEGWVGKCCQERWDVIPSLRRKQSGYSNTTYSSYCSMFRRRLDNNCSMFRRRLDLTYTWYKIQVLDCIGVHVYCETCMYTILHPDLLICGKRQRRWYSLFFWVPTSPNTLFSDSIPQYLHHHCFEKNWKKGYNVQRSFIPL